MGSFFFVAYLYRPTLYNKMHLVTNKSSLVLWAVVMVKHPCLWATTRPSGFQCLSVLITHKKRSVKIHLLWKNAYWSPTQAFRPRMVILCRETRECVVKHFLLFYLQMVMCRGSEVTAVGESEGPARVCSGVRGEFAGRVKLSHPRTHGPLISSKPLSHTSDFQIRVFVLKMGSNPDPSRSGRTSTF